MAEYHNYYLHFSVGELSCQLLRAIPSMQLSTRLSPENYFTHKHPHLELHYVMAGHCSYAAGQTTYEARPNQLLVFPPDTEHLLKQVSPPLHRLIVSLHIQPPPSRTQSPSHRLYAALHSPSPLLLEAPPGSLLAEVLGHIRALTQKGVPDFSMQETMRAYSALLLAALSGLLVEGSAPSLPSPSQACAPQSFLIDQFFYYPSAMKEGAPALAKMLNVSPRQLDRILLEHCGMNFREKLNQTKLNYAVDLLSNPELSIAQIAHLLGYSTSTAFSAFIKKATGRTPSQIRQAQRSSGLSL